jgi:hypothetical protein
MGFALLNPSYRVAPRMAFLRRAWFGRTGLCAAIAALAIASAGSAETAVDLQLVLAVDASGSVDQARFDLQMRGYAAAFRNPLVLHAIQSGRRQSIAVTMTQWTGPRLQVQVIPWTLIKDEASAAAVAAAIEGAPRRLFGGGTSISGAIDNGKLLFPLSPYAGGREVIDISGDGANNAGRSVTQARDEAVGADIGINGLPILSLEPDLDTYYRDFVIGGPGAFVIAAKTYDQFADAIQKKLILEIAANGNIGLKSYSLRYFGQTKPRT